MFSYAQISMSLNHFNAHTTAHPRLTCSLHCGSIRRRRYPTLHRPRAGFILLLYMLHRVLPWRRAGLRRWGRSMPLLPILLRVYYIPSHLHPCDQEFGKVYQAWVSAHSHGEILTVLNDQYCWDL